MPEVVQEGIMDKWSYYLSMADVARLDICQGGNCANLTKEQLTKTLFENGMDTQMDYQFIKDTHRCLDGSIQDTVRILGTMRTDDSWKEVYGTNIHAVIAEMQTTKKYRGGDAIASKVPHPKGTEKDEKALRNDAKAYNKIRQGDIKRHRGLDLDLTKGG